MDAFCWALSTNEKDGDSYDYDRLKQMTLYQRALLSSSDDLIHYYPSKKPFSLNFPRVAQFCS